MYFNYCATQVMHHFGGFQWLDWNLELREHLLATQSPSGHENGSWYFVDKQGVQGGRLYNTAMCVMMLEVYYRFMPLYTERTVDQELARNEEWSARSRRNVKPCEFFL